MGNKQFSRKINIFHGRTAPEEGTLVGYGAVIEAYSLAVPLPEKLSLISTKKRQYDTDGWRVFTSRHEPEDTLFKHLVFGLKYEGINLAILKKLFDVLAQHEVEALVRLKSLGQPNRKLWFLYEWLTGQKLNIPDLSSGNLVPLIDEKLQYTIPGKSSSRHRILNNLPGIPGFCPLIFRTPKLEAYIQSGLATKKDKYLGAVRKDVLQRAAAFLLLKDSKASFTIEGEDPKNQRAARWGNAIGQAGVKPLSEDELIRLQQIVIESKRFTKMGFRKQGGFVGEHDRVTGEPIPDHISARWQDIDTLIDGLISTNNILKDENDFDAVLTAAMIAFGFVFIHPFVDGNGRLHRYLIHHILAGKKFSNQGVIFPVSASILNHIDDYRKTLEEFSGPLLELIEWKTTIDHNVEVLNNTIDYYRYFDATPQAEFLYACVEDTITNVIPAEVKYLQGYDEMKYYLDNSFEMPDKMVALLVRFLENNQGKLSKRARKKEFGLLTDAEVLEIENKFSEIFEV